MKFNLIQIVLYIVFNSLSFTFAQEIKINEVSSSNKNIIQDLDGEYSDWFELYNKSSNPINLSKYYISDDAENLTKWKCPNIEIEPDSVILIFASGKDRSETVSHWETVIREGDICNYLIPPNNISDEWRSIHYIDSTWSIGQTGIGYGDEDDNTIIPQTISAYLRCKFTVADITQVSGLFLNIDFDDGFVVYLNGEEIARENMGAIGDQVFYNSTATTDHEAQLYQGNSTNAYRITDRIELLQNGENVLAIEVHNVNSTSSDLTLIPFLSVGYNFTPIISRGSLDFLNLQESKLHTNFKLNASGEFLILSNANGEIEDSLNTRKQISDISFGRFPNGSENLFFFGSPTPGKRNIDNGFTEFLKPPIFSVPRGFYAIPFFLDITNPNSTGIIRYTLDGSAPNKYSTVYTNQLVVSGTSVIRAKIFSDSLFSSRYETHTYFVNQEQRLPIISLTTNPEHFFDSDSGIYVLGPNAESENPNFGANFWQDWERPIHVEFFEENQKFGFEIDLGVKIFGQWSRANRQKSLAFYARGKYGYSEINYKLFPNSELNKFQSFILRNSGNDWSYTMIRDPLMGEIVSPLNIDRQMYRPVVVYLNGEYWGIHNLREKVNKHFLESHHGISSDDINIIENGFNLVNGEKENYEEFYNSLNNIDMTTESAFEYIDSKIDVNEFIDYYLTEIFIDNQDWPGNNIKFWQQNSTNSKWRWILYDTDFGFGIYNQYAYNQNTLAFALEKNGPGWPNPPWSTFLLRKFLQNDIFKNLFISRYSTYLNTIFSPNSINKVIDNLTSKIRHEMPQHIERWGNTYPNWITEINRLRTFANRRTSYLTQYFKSYFNINGEFQLSINQNMGQGIIEITDFEITQSTWNGSFFDDIPLNILAIPAPKFIFSHWEGDINTTDNPVRLITDSDVTLSPVYIPVSDTQIVINEINYNSHNLFNPEDWVEFYNYSEHPIDLSSWVFKDDGSSQDFVIPKNKIIASSDYIVICRDTALFKSKFPNVENYFGNLAFGLSRGGELISLFNNNGFLIDSLTYEDKDPWPTECDGGGATLELKNPSLDNSKYFNWIASEKHGTPGEINSVFTSVTNEQSILPKKFKLLQNYPNPFNPLTIITFIIPSKSYVTISVYNLLGEKVKTLVNEFYTAGSFDVEFDGSYLSSGVYLIRIRAGQQVETIKSVLIK